MAEIIVVQGPPGSGKSTLASRLESEGIKDRHNFTHISAGDRLRAIRTGQITSRYKDMVGQPGQSKMIDHYIMTGLMFEAMEVPSIAPVALFDGYPRFVDAVPLFLEGVLQGQHKLLGTLLLELSKEAAVARIKGRGTRLGESLVSDEFIQRRYEDFLEFTMPAVALLSKYSTLNKMCAEQEPEPSWLTFCNAIAHITNKLA